MKYSIKVTIFRWPSPSLPPTLKKPRPGDTYRLGAGTGRTRAGFISGYENSSFDNWSDSGTGKSKFFLINVTSVKTGQKSSSPSLTQKIFRNILDILITV